MNFSEYFERVLSSSSGEWNHQACWGANSAPSYRDRFLVTDNPSAKTWRLDVESHSNVAVFKPDLAISIAWGLKQNEKLTEKWHASFADSSASSFFIDFFYNSALVHRELGATVDGGRAELPMPRHVHGQLVVPERRTRFFRLLNSIAGVNDFDSYLLQAGFEVGSDPWPA